MKIAILGYGVEGQAAYEYWYSGNDITICDQNEALELPPGVKSRLGADYLRGLDEFDLIVRSPNLHPKAIIDANSPDIVQKVTSSTNEFFRVCPTKNIIGVTGTKGKGTTSTLVARILEAAGYRVHLGGNIGIAALTLLKEAIQPDDWVVLELSNFQLIDLKHSPHIAACLLVMPEHLDWHVNLDEYIAAKQQLFRWQTAEDQAIYYQQNDYSKQIVSISEAQKIPYMQAPGALVENGEVRIDGQTICRTDELKLLGRHNWQNVCAATTIVWQVTQNVEAIRSIVTSFSGLPFRIEFRKEVGGIRYYNDSFASGPGASIAAMRAIPEKKVMILGGFDRGLDLVDFAEALNELKDGIRKVLVIGASGERLAQELDKHGCHNYVLSNVKTMPEIVHEATELAEPGDAVVLSPGFASYDMFKNFEDRGRKFNAAVEAL